MLIEFIGDLKFTLFLFHVYSKFCGEQVLFIDPKGKCDFVLKTLILHL
jgi:hypothetical protein